jgi:hypothetical protein
MCPSKLPNDWRLTPPAGHNVVLLQSANRSAVVYVPTGQRLTTSGANAIMGNVANALRSTTEGTAPVPIVATPDLTAMDIKGWVMDNAAVIGAGLAIVGILVAYYFANRKKKK